MMAVSSAPSTGGNGSLRQRKDTAPDTKKEAAATRTSSATTEPGSAAKDKEVTTSSSNMDSSSNDHKTNDTGTTPDSAAKSKKRRSRHEIMQAWGSNAVVVAILAYGAFVAFNFYRMCYPIFPAQDAAGNPIRFVKNSIKPGATLEAVVYLRDELTGSSRRTSTADLEKKENREEIWRFTFPYTWGDEEYTKPVELEGAEGSAHQLLTKEAIAKELDGQPLTRFDKLQVPIKIPLHVLENVNKKIVEIEVYHYEGKEIENKEATARKKNKGNKSTRKKLIARSEASVVKWIKKEVDEMNGKRRKYNLMVPFSSAEGRTKRIAVDEYGETEEVAYDPVWEAAQDQYCPEKKEPIYAKKSYDHKADAEKTEWFVVRGLPKLQLKLVFDEDEYPWWFFERDSSGYLPQTVVDNFWLTDDQLTKFDALKKEEEGGKALSEQFLHFNASFRFDLMSSARWRFQHTMEERLQATAASFGENSEEALQMRDLFANTSPTLLVVTLIVSILHMIFEFLAFKADVQFWNSQSAETLNKYVSVTSVLLNIVFETILLLYLVDQGSNFLIVVFSVISIVIECWKVTKAMYLDCYFLFGFIPLPKLRARIEKTGANWDWIAIKYLSFVLLPVVIAYAGYSLYFECHKGWYSFLLETAASCVYAGGFILMTPQLFINYKLKSVAFLPWRRFVYRALNTFVDDLFSFIIRMPTMHRMGCFRDDVVFFVYLYQRWIYPVDKNRMFGDDDDLEEFAELEKTGAGGGKKSLAAGGSGHRGEVEMTSSKKKK